MQIGFNAPTAGPLSATDQMVRLVVEAEAMGFDYATFSDHVVIPTDITAKYPYSSTGEFPAGARAERHEQLIQMAFVAGRTTRLRLVSSVMVVPHRPAVLTAKMLSSIDVLSGGRLVVGIGAGWLKPEIDAVAVVPPAASPFDLDGSGRIDFGDLAFLMLSMGEACGPCDLDQSGLVDDGPTSRVDEYGGWLHQRQLACARPAGEHHSETTLPERIRHSGPSLRQPFLEGPPTRRVDDRQLSRRIEPREFFPQLRAVRLRMEPQRPGLCGGLH